MAANRQYYTLLASLPALPHFERADRVPINRVRLLDRLSMLEPEDRDVVDRTADFLSWRRQPPERTDAQMVSMYEGLAELDNPPALDAMIQHDMDQRTILAALRRRKRGLPVPERGQPWGVGEWVLTIERNWDQPDFKLGTVFPWIPQARQYLEARDTLALDRLLLNDLWRWLETLDLGSKFTFEAVLGYLFQWSIVDQWLSYDSTEAKNRFEEMVAEVTGEHYQLFD